MYNVHGRVIVDNMYEFQHFLLKKIVIYDIGNGELQGVSLE